MADEDKKSSKKELLKKRNKKIKAYKKLAEEMFADDYVAEKKFMSSSGNDVNVNKRLYNAKLREEGTIAKKSYGNKGKGMTDIASVIKETGDPYLGQLGMLKTKYKKRSDAKAAGRFSERDKETGKRKILSPQGKAKGGEVKGYHKGGPVHKKKNTMATTKGWGASRKT